MLNRPFEVNRFLAFVSEFLPGFISEKRKVRVANSSLLQNITYLGSSSRAEVSVLEVECDESAANRRVGITQAAFKVLNDHGIRHALIAFHGGGDVWRLSFLTSSLTLENGKVVKTNSNPRRYSYLLGAGAKTKTPYQSLIGKGAVATLQELRDRFSVEAVNREFYSVIAELFTRLVGGERASSSYPGLLELDGVISKDLKHQEFAVRLIGRVIFAWFLKEKKSQSGVPLVPEELLSTAALSRFPDYYHSALEPLFFELLNKRSAQRAEQYRQAPFNLVPYLNGGLFTPQKDDHYQASKWHNTQSRAEIPDEWFEALFEVLERFNFTVDENTSYNTELSIDPEMLGRIFENLLAEINPETGESARKSTGSYYTPREIVDFMVDTSIIDFLLKETDILESKVRAVVSWDPNDDEEDSLSKNERELLVKALGTFKILDPACGSGAFPIGLLQKIVYVLQQVDPCGEIWLQQQLKGIESPELRRDIEKKYERENYDWLRKFGVIRETIFGVDIQPVATEISRLRCFLTLIIDEEINDNEENRGVHPLPNLDFKFVTANSLVGLPGGQPAGDNVPFDMFENSAHINELKDIRSEYFAADLLRRQELQLQFRNLQNEMLQSTIDSNGTVTDLYKALSRWNPFNHDAVGWFDSEWMFGVSGFDVVIANPPYVGEKGNKQIFEPLKSTSLGRRFYRGKMDLFYYFFHLGLDILKHGGTLSFITTNYFPTADGALKLRKDIYDRSDVLKLINFGELTVFDSAKGQHNLITVLRKSEPPRESQLTEQIISLGKGSIRSGALGGVLNGQDDLVNKLFVTRDNLYDNSTSNYYIRFQDGGDSLNELFDLFVSKFPRLGELCNVNQGIITGADKFSDAHARKFPEISAKKADGIFVFSRGEASSIASIESTVKPWYKNSDISQYVTGEDSDQELLYLDGTGEIDEGAVTYLERFKPILRNRREFQNGKRPWFTLHWARSEAIFNGEKIVAPQRSFRNTFAYNDQPWYASADVYFITPKPGTEFESMYLLGVLNSSLIYKWLYHRGKRKGEMLELYRTPLTEIPIAQPDTELRSSIVERVRKIMSIKGSDSNADVTQIQKEIDLLVLEAYEVSEDALEAF